MTDEIPKDIYGLPDTGAMTRQQMKVFVASATVIAQYSFNCIVCGHWSAKSLGVGLYLRNKRSKYSRQRGRMEMTSFEVSGMAFTCYSCLDAAFKAYDLKEKEAAAAAKELPKAIEEREAAINFGRPIEEVGT